MQNLNWLIKSWNLHYNFKPNLSQVMVAIITIPYIRKKPIEPFKSSLVILNVYCEL